MLTNLLVLREAQMTVNEKVKDQIKRFPIVKWLLCLLALGYLLHFPEAIAHGIVWVAHTFYEATSFVLEEFLRHTFGFDKFLAQLTVFYFSVVVGIGGIFLVWRPAIRALLSLRDYALRKLYAYQYRLVYYWRSQRTAQKIKLILIHSALMISGFMFLLM